jgi:hypothetical protein
MMMTMASQRARGRGHRAFYLHPESQVGSSGGSSEEPTPEGEASRVTVADSPASTTQTGTEPESNTAGSTSQ